MLKSLMQFLDTLVAPSGSTGAARADDEHRLRPVSYTHLTLPTNREV